MFCDPINQDLCTGVICDAGLACEGGQCVDVDECADGSHMCDSFETCVNENGSYSCTFDHSVCPESQVVWKGAKFGRVFYRGEKSIELRVTITNKNIDVRDSTYLGMLFRHVGQVLMKVYYFGVYYFRNPLYLVRII